MVLYRPTTENAIFIQKVSQMSVEWTPLKLKEAFQDFPHTKTPLQERTEEQLASNFKQTDLQEDLQEKSKSFNQDRRPIELPDVNCSSTKLQITVQETSEATTKMGKLANQLAKFIEIYKKQTKKALNTEKRAQSQKDKKKIIFPWQVWLTKAICWIFGVSQKKIDSPQVAPRNRIS
jgi:hypothetical protein